LPGAREQWVRHSKYLRGVGVKNISHRRQPARVSIMIQGMPARSPIQPAERRGLRWQDDQHINNSIAG